MKRKTGWYAAFAVCMMSLLAGCSDEECLETGKTPVGNVVLKGIAETKNASRSALSDTGVFSWLKGDQIDVYASDGSYSQFDLTAGEGTNSGNFSGEMPEGQTLLFAVSPAGLSPYLNENEELWLNLPSAYTWDGAQTHAPMYSEVEGDKLYFKNLGGLMKFSLSNINKGCRIEVTSDAHQLAGQIKVTEDAEGNSILAAVEAEESRMVTFTSNSDEEKQAFYLPVPVSEDSMKFSVKVFDAAENGNERFTRKTSLPVIRRNELIIMPTLIIPEKENAVVQDAVSTEGLNAVLEEAVKTEGEKPAEVIVVVNSNTNLEEGEKASTTVEVSAPIEIPTALTAPETSGEGSETPGEGTEEEVEVPVVKIVFDEVPVATNAENTIVLTDGQKVDEVESTESKSEVNVSIPEAPEGVEPPSFEITLPTTTVTLTATQETATFNQVTAATADNTLRVGRGVTIKNLFVISGNIEVSGKIDKIENHSGKTVYVRVSGAGEVGEVIGDVSVIREGDDINTPFENEEIADGQNIPYQIANLEQLRSLANRVDSARINKENRPYSECFYVLTADIDLGKDMLWKPIGTEQHSFAGIFDGDGHVISGRLNLGACDNAGFFGRVHNGATIKNLTIAANIQIISEGVTTSGVVGAFAGNIDRVTFENCHFTGNISISTNYLGGFVGTATNGTFNLCSNTGNLTNLNVNGNIGGFIGISNQSTLTGCYAIGNYTLDPASGVCGGLVGQNFSNATFNACWTSGEYIAQKAGGLFGNGGHYYINKTYWRYTQSYGIGHNGGYSGNGWGSFGGSVLPQELIDEMNKVIYRLGWQYNSEGVLEQMEGNFLPSNPIQPW